MRSRCLRVPFLPVADALVREMIIKEGRVPKAQQELAVRIAAGSITAARVFDAAEYARRRRPWADFLESVTRRRGTGKNQPDWDALFNSTKALAEKREDFEETLRIGYLILRDLELVCELGKAGSAANIDILPHVTYWAEALGLRGITRIKEGLDQAVRLQVRNVNQQLNFETLAIDLLEARPAIPR